MRLHDPFAVELRHGILLTGKTCDPRQSSWRTGRRQIDDRRNPVAACDSVGTAAEPQGWKTRR
jgi:hypothetical protein